MYMYTPEDGQPQVKHRVFWYNKLIGVSIYSIQSFIVHNRGNVLFDDVKTLNYIEATRCET
jgi:hypothetical protein